MVDGDYEAVKANCGFSLHIHTWGSPLRIVEGKFQFAVQTVDGVDNG